ncbi:MULTISPECIES: ADP-glyceromanno-heptose 6-epimerase [Aquimarina]|nr:MULTISPECIES: ADP-glyceromanno-heptose 6-epimerase [Aquimarina]
MEINFNNKTILITGGAGFIGSNIAFYLQKNYPDSKIIIFDVFRKGETFDNGNLKSFGHYKNLIGFKGDIICGDIKDEEDLNKLKFYKLDFIFHYAAISDTRVYDQEIIMKTNVNSFYNLLEVAKKNEAGMIYASSAATYGSSPSPQKIGDDSPENVYGFSKYAMDQIAYRYMKEYSNMHIVGLKFFNVYGEKEYFKNKTASMVIQLGHQIIAGKSPRLFIGSDKIMRDFVYVKDVILANILACFTKKNGIYNIGSGVHRSFYDIVNILQQELNTNLKIEYFENPYKGYQMHTRADISLSQEFLGYKPNYTLEQGIKEYIPYIKQTFNWDKKQ